MVVVGGLGEGHVSGGPETRTPCSQDRGPGFDPGQGTPSCMLQLRVNMLQLRLGTAKINK